MKKKLERQLLAAGFFYKKDNTYMNVYFKDPSDSEDVDLSQTYSLEEINKSNIKWFGLIKQEINFQGNDWDGLKKRLEESEDWYSSASLWRNGYDINDLYSIHPEHKEVVNPRTVIWFSANPHQIWKLLDKIDAAKAKGGKQVVKFKGCEYEFDFPVADVTLNNFTANELTGQAFIDEVSEVTDDMVDNLKPTKTPKQAEWKQVTDYDSIRYNGTPPLYYPTADKDNNNDIIQTSKHRYPSLYATEKQAKQALAWAKITQIHKAIINASGGVAKNIDENGLWFESILLNQSSYYFDDYLYKDLSCTPYCTPFEIQFYTVEQRDHFIKHNKELIHQYLGI